MQHSGLPFAALWYPVAISGCLASLWIGKQYKDIGLLEIFLLLWGIYIALQGFFIRPVYGGAFNMSVLTIAPLMYFSLRGAKIKGLLIVLGGLALCLLYQYDLLSLYVNACSPVNSRLEPVASGGSHAHLV